MSSTIEDLSFEIIKEEFPELAKDGNYAKQYFNNDPDGCLNKIRRIGESIVYEIYKQKEKSLEKYQPKDQKANILNLESKKYINNVQATWLREIQEKGSVGSHIEKKELSDKPVSSVSDEERKDLLRKCYDLCLWFTNKYGAKHAFFDRMKEFFFWRDRLETKDSSFPKINIDEKNDYYSLSSSALEMLENSILETISNERKSFDNYIDETIFDKHSIIKMFRYIPGENIRISTNEVPQWLYKFIINDNPAHKSHEGPNLPVENVSWYDAVIFCNRLSEFMGISPAYDIIGSHVSWEKESHGFRLPTIDEWQEAAKKNIYDAWGNVGEWCEDYYKKRNKKAVCGCAWNSGKEDYTKDFIRDLPTDTKRDTIGFRIVHDFK